MSNQDWQVVILTVAGLAATMFPVAYAFLAKPWYRSQFGRSLMISETSLAVLIDMSLLAYWFHFVVPPPLVTGIFTLVALGSCLRLAALLSEQLGKEDDR